MMRSRVNLSFVPVLVALTVPMAANSAWAGGFALNEQSVKSMGNAFAGTAATAYDASTIYYNPAALTRLEGTSIVTSFFAIFPTINFRNQGSTVATGAPLTGGNSGDAGVDIVVPNLYAAWSVSDSVKLGLGINVPYGLVTSYDRNWVGRYQAVESKLSTININPTIAAKLSDNLSVGAGLNIQYAEATLSNAIDFGSSLGRPQGADGFVKVTGSDWSVGYNLGLLYKPSKTTRIGLSYRSPIRQDIRGNADFTLPTLPPAIASRLTAGGRFTDTGATAVLNLPDTLSLAVYQQVSPKVSLMGDVTWTQWSRFQELRVKFANPNQLDSVQPENWQDTYRFGVGVNYAVNDKLTLRTGVSYDPSPIQDKFNSPRLPGGDRTLVGIGASYQPSKSFNIDVGYTHVFSDNSSINQTNNTGDTLRGEFASSVDIIGIQANWQF